MRSIRLILGSLGVVSILALVLASPTLAQRIRPNIPDGGGTAPQISRPPSMDESVQVMVELSDAPAAVTWAAAHKKAQAQLDAERSYALQNPTLPASQAMLKKTPQQASISSADAAQIESIKDNIDQKQQLLMPSLTGAGGAGGAIGGKVIFRTQIAYNGIAMVVSPKQISAIAALPGVKAVHPMHPKYLVTTFSDIDFLNTRPAWTTGPFGTHGENIKVADIDTGLDYIHRDFGGSGSKADYSKTKDKSAVPNVNFPTQKIPNGTDLVGDSYNADPTSPAFQPIPHPDNNPLDCNGHGTATASLIGGFGVTNAGFTYSGNYDGSNPSIAALSLPPGFAPAAKIIPVRVFGCAGSTNVVTQAIEWAMTQGTGNPANRVDVINMSLGANEGFADDPDDVAASNAAAAGIIVCSAAGNAGDSYYIHSSPAAAVGTLGVAATFNDQNGFIFDSNVTGNAPVAISGTKFFSIKGTASSAIPAGGITGNVVYAVPNIANGPLTNAAQVAGNICLIDRGAVTFTSKITQAFNAGASAVIIDNFTCNPSCSVPILMSTAGQPSIVDVMISRNDRDTIVAASGGFDPVTGVPTNPVNVTINNDRGTKIIPTNPPGSPGGAGSPDTVASYSSRGPGLPDSSTKPDIAAPAEVTAVAQSAAEVSPVPSFAGRQFENFNGTSSATPHVSGMMALLRQLHPDWSVQELLALACNTATHDLFTTEPGASPSPTPPVQYGVGRIGAGRIDVGNAARATAVAFESTDANRVGMSFGVVETPVDGSSTLTKDILLENKGTTKLKYTLTYQPVTPVPGANFHASPSNITIPAGTSKTIPVTFTAAGNKLKHARETSVADNQLGVSRQWLTETGGYAVFTPSDGSPTLRVELYAAIKPVSAMHTRTTSVAENGASTGSFTLKVNGAAVNTGPNLGGGFDILSLVKAFELQYAATGTSNDRLKVKNVGVTSDYVNHAAGADKANTLMMFGAEKFGDAATPDFASSDTEIFFDTNPSDIGVSFHANFAAFLGNLGQAFGVAGAENVFFPILVDLGTNSIVGAEDFTNGLDASTADTNIYNNSGIVFPIFATDIGLIGASGTGNTKFQYAVATFDRNGNFVDASNILIYDVANPGLEVENSAGAAGVNTVPSQSAPFFEPFWYQDLTKNSIPVNYNRANFLNNGSLGVWLFHTHNGDGNRSDLVTVTP